jgi:hypothetical protein
LCRQESLPRGDDDRQSSTKKLTAACMIAMLHQLVLAACIKSFIPYKKIYMYCYLCASTVRSFK